MNNPVIMKGNKSGIVLVLDSTADFRKIIEALDSRLAAAAGHYDRHVKMALTIESRRLSNPELDEILNLFERYGIIISDIIDGDVHNGTPERLTAKTPMEMFYIGNLKSGQVLHAANTIVIVGSVMAGASVISTGSINVLGVLAGDARAGADGRKDVFISALRMNPEKLGIADILYTRDKMEGSQNDGYAFPAMAYAEDGNMFMRRI